MAAPDASPLSSDQTRRQPVELGSPKCNRRLLRSMGLRESRVLRPMAAFKTGWDVGSMLALLARGYGFGIRCRLMPKVDHMAAICHTPIN